MKEETHMDQFNIHRTKDNILIGALSDAVVMSPAP